MVEPLSDGWDSWLTREDVDWAYVRINRTGNTWLNEYLTANGFIQQDPRSLREIHKLVIVREPLERFVSGVSMFKGLSHRLIGQPKTILARYSSDPHIKTQSEFLRNVDLGNCTFIKYGPNIVSDLQSFIEERKLTLFFPPPTEWRDNPVLADYHKMSETEQEYFAERKLLYDAYKNDPFLQKVVDQHLKNDYNLYNSMEWYGTN
jgi:hypothetical protein